MNTKKLNRKWTFILFFMLVMMPAIACDDSDDDYQINVRENNQRSKPTPAYLYVEDK